ncbi:MAG: 23S rRNA (pseudouridine(1915)-N(3))-methyltransferase RlmH [Acutalibacteraceae bacterium]
MMKINIICVGKLKEKYLVDASAEYIKRLSAFCRFSLTEIGEYKLPDNPSKAMITKALEEEGKAIISKISPKSETVAMCIEGKQLDSPGLSDFISRSAVDGFGNITFIIGGSYGLSDEVKKISGLRLSMSEMTFPHQLARVMLLEQIYRAFMISGGGKYHK